MLTFTIDLMASVGMAIIVVTLVCLVAASIWRTVLELISRHRKQQKQETRKHDVDKKGG